MILTWILTMLSRFPDVGVKKNKSLKSWHNNAIIMYSNRSDKDARN